MIQTWAPEDLWAVAQPLIPVAAKRPQGGGKRRADDRAVLAAIAYMVQAGCSWRKLPAPRGGIMRAEARAVLAVAPTPTQAATLTTDQLADALRRAGRQRGIKAEADRHRSRSARGRRASSRSLWLPSRRG
ncbi:transposase [Dactylosporangium salmoneum]|uniref:transposase n=1 Tax=Dactylosporangium salmoneum TaxID=53361 RepID=UPI0031E362AA